MNSTSYMFVDGGYLKRVLEGMRDNFYGTEPKINYRGLQGDCRKAFYYDAYPGRKSSQDDDEFQASLDRAEEMFSEISSTPGWHVVTGFTKGRGKRVRQKGVDTRLAIDALMHRIRGNFDEIILVAGDLDFQPLAMALVESGAYVTLLCERSSVSDELRHAVDKVLFLGPSNASKYASNWKDCNRSFRQQNDDTLQKGKLVKEGSYLGGPVAVVQNESGVHFSYKTEQMRMYHEKTFTSLKQAIYFASAELPTLQWS